MKALLIISLFLCLGAAAQSVNRKDSTPSGSTVHELTAVKVNSRKPLVQVLPDKTVFNVQASLSAAGVSAFELLRKAPGVIVDNQDNLIVEGKTGAKIYIDGKLSMLAGDDLVNYLKTLQSSDVESIEIITRPSSKYDAAGTAGIINLKLVRNKNFGTNGSVTAGYAIGTYPKINESFNINNRSAKYNFFGSYTRSDNKNYSFLNLDRFQSGYEYDQRSFFTGHNHTNNFRAGADAYLSKASTLGVLVSGSFSDNDGINTSRTPIRNLASNTIGQVLKAFNYSGSTNSNTSANFNYRYTGRNGTEFTADADYGYYRNEGNSLQPNYYFNGDESMVTSQVTYRMITPVTVRLFSFKADYTRTIAKTRFSAGIKTSLVKTGNVFGFYDVDQGAEKYNAGRSNTFDYTENINAAYINVSRDWKKLSIQAGIRLEQTVSDGELLSAQQNPDNIVRRNYLDAFPSGGITFKANDNNSFALTYSSRVERPNYRSLNPFESNIDELSFSKGNPFLKPQYTNSIALSHTYRYTLTTTLSYSYITNFFAQITDTLGNNRNYISPQNIADQKVVNLGVSYPFNAAKWWNVYTSVNLYRSTYSSINPKFDPIDQTTLSFYGQNTFSLPAGYKFEVSGWYSSPSIWAGTYHTHSLGSLDIAVQKVFLDGKLSIRAALSDVLFTSNWTGTTQYGQLIINGSGGYESRQFRLTASYKFGRKTVKAAAVRKSGIEEEKGRINVP